MLLPKEGKLSGTLSAYRPIYLLDDDGKIFERIIEGRIVQHLQTTGTNLHEEQYGFREARSTVDAIGRVNALTNAIVEDGRVAMVSLDISNAFNSLPWDAIGAGLSSHRIPPYIQVVLKEYLSGRPLQTLKERSRWAKLKLSTCGPGVCIRTPTVDHLIQGPAGETGSSRMLSHRLCR